MCLYGEIHGEVGSLVIEFTYSFSTLSCIEDLVVISAQEDLRERIELGDIIFFEGEGLIGRTKIIEVLGQVSLIVIPSQGVGLTP